MIQNYGGSGIYSEDGKGGYIWRRNTQDGHGGRAEEHRQEMMQIAERIAEQKIAEVIPEIRRTSYIQSYNDLVHALYFDVESVVNIGFENGRQIFSDSRTQKVVAEAIKKEIAKQLKSL